MALRAQVLFSLVMALSALMVANSRVAQGESLPTALLTVAADGGSQTGLPPLIASDITPSGNATSTGGLGIDASVTASSSTTEESNPNSAYANLTFYFELIGPANSAIPIVTAGNISSSTSVYHNVDDIASAGASLLVLACGTLTAGVCQNTPTVYDTGALAFGVFSGLDYGGVATSGSFSTSFTVAADMIYAVYMIAQAQTVDSFGTEAASALIDPTFGLDPNLPNASQYVFAASAGFTPSVPGTTSTSVPEPNSLLLLCSAAIALALWRQRTAMA